MSATLLTLLSGVAFGTPNAVESKMPSAVNDAPAANDAASNDTNLPRSKWEVSASAVSGRAPVLPGLALGATAEARRRVRLSPFFVSARLRGTASSAANESWLIEHQQFSGALGVGADRALGAGRIWAQLGGGASVLSEVLSRHQLTRIESAGVPGGQEHSLSVGPMGFLEVGVTLQMRGNVSAVFAGGPTLSRNKVDGTASWRVGCDGRIGVAYEF